MSSERVAFLDFWPGFGNRITPLHEALARLGVGVVAHHVDATAVIYSDFGTRHWEHSGRRIHFSGENIIPDFTRRDAAITSALVDDVRHYRMPFWAFSCTDPKQLSAARRDGSVLAVRHSGFCSFVASNPRAPERNRAFRCLHRRSAVSSGGRCFNTVGRRVTDKQAFLASHRFNLCYENSSSPGYTTEKLADAFLAGTIPIYWGNPEVHRDFNRHALIYAADFADESSLADFIVRLWADLDGCVRMLSEPIFSDEAQAAPLSIDLLCAALDRFLTIPLAQRPLKQTTRRLRNHCYRSPLHQSVVSAKCRFDALMWRVGILR